MPIRQIVIAHFRKTFNIEVSNGTRIGDLGEIPDDFFKRLWEICRKDRYEPEPPGLDRDETVGSLIRTLELLLGTATIR